MSLWNDHKIKKLRIASIRCGEKEEFGGIMRKCNVEATHTFEEHYICADCLMKVLMMKIYRLENPPKSGYISRLATDENVPIIDKNTVRL